MRLRLQKWLVVLLLGLAVGALSNGCRSMHQKSGDPMDGGKVCGGIRGLPCPDGQLCDLPAGECHSADLEGVCVEKPEVCPEIYKPVCGCDGKTYGNDCERRAAGAQKDHDGGCGEE